MDKEIEDEVEVHGVCAECGEHCSGMLVEDGDTYSECCGTEVYEYERGEG